MHRLFKHYLRRYGIWWSIKHYFRIRRQIILVSEISNIWSSESFSEFTRSDEKYGFSFTKVETLCIEYINKKAQNYQNQLKYIFGKDDKIYRYIKGK